MTVPPSEHLQGRRFDARSQNLVQAVTGHDVGLAAEDARSLLLYIHQFKQAELASFVVEEQIDVRILTRLAARCRPEQIKMLDPKLAQLGFMRSQFLYRVVSFHGSP